MAGVDSSQPPWHRFSTYLAAFLIADASARLLLLSVIGPVNTAKVFGIGLGLLLAVCQVWLGLQLIRGTRTGWWIGSLYAALGIVLWLIGERPELPLIIYAIASTIGYGVMLATLLWLRFGALIHW